MLHVVELYARITALISLHSAIYSCKLSTTLQTKIYALGNRKKIFKRCRIFILVLSTSVFNVVFFLGGGGGHQRPCIKNQTKLRFKTKYEYSLGSRIEYAESLYGYHIIRPSVKTVLL